jgi:hypothetical protein
MSFPTSTPPNSHGSRPRPSKVASSVTSRVVPRTRELPDHAEPIGRRDEPALDAAALERDVGIRLDVGEVGGTVVLMLAARLGSGQEPGAGSPGSAM